MARRKKSLLDIANQYGRIMRGINDELRNTNNMSSERIATLNKRVATAFGKSREYQNNIVSRRGGNGTANPRTKYSQSTYMGLSNG